MIDKLLAPVMKILEGFFSKGYLHYFLYFLIAVGVFILVKVIL